jgi:hypothetical protein
MVEQSFTNRYIDEQKLLTLLRARFPRKTYTVQVSTEHLLVHVPRLCPMPYGVVCDESASCLFLALGSSPLSACFLTSRHPALPGAVQATTLQ